MSINLVDLVMKQVGGNLPGILGSLLGESADRTQGAVAGAVPAILGGLMGAASKGGGIADQIGSMISQQDDGMLDNLAGAFGSGNHQQIADQGSSMLTSLLGDGMVGTLVGAIGKFSGLGGGSTKSLLGMLAPIVMSVLGRQQREQGLDAGGMLGLLMDQKDNIQGAMPKGMASALGGAGFLDDLMGSAQSATASIGEALDTTAGTVGKVAGGAATAVGAAAENVKETVTDTASQAAASTSAAVSQGAEAISQGAEAVGKTAENVASGASKAASDASAAVSGAASEGGGSVMRWLIPLVILLGLLWFAFQYLSGGDVEQAASDAADSAEDAATSAVEATTDAASDAADAVSEAAGDAADAAADAAGDAADTASEAAGDAVDAAGDAAGAAADTASDAADAATATASDAADAASEAAGDAAGAASDAASAAADQVTAMVGDIDVGGELASLFDGVTGALSNVTDQASAEAAVPALEEFSGGLDSLTGLAEQLPEAAVGGISEMVTTGLNGMDGAMQALKDIPGVGEYIEPLIAEIREKLAAFTSDA